VAGVPGECFDTLGYALSQHSQPGLCPTSLVFDSVGL